jgi:large subunit ribosomal protein L25
MKSIELKGNVRTTLGKNSSEKLRNKKHVPCILYGGKELIHFSVEEPDLKPIIYTPHVYLIDLEIDGKKHKAKIHALQFHPVTDKVIHIDFYEVDADKKIIIELPVKIEGNSIGVREGGKLIQDLRKLKVRGLVKNLPDEIVVDISPVAIGKSIRVEDLSLKNIDFLDFKNSPVVSVKLTRAARGTAETAGAEAAPAPGAK